MTIFTRRAFMGSTAAASFIAGTGALGALTSERAFAADTSGYKALVCVFFKGGMDHADTILPIDQSEFDLLSTERGGLLGSHGVGSGTSSRDPANILRLNPTGANSLGGRSIGLPVQMRPMVDMFNAGDMAVVGNVGPLIEPTTRATYEDRAVALPKRLFSHNDQQSTWMALAVEGERFGWGGRFADIALASSPGADDTYASISVGSNDVFLSGENTRPINLSNGEAPELRIFRDRNFIGRGAQSDLARERIKAALSRSDFSDGNVFEQDMARTIGNAIPLGEDFAAAIEMAPPMDTVFPGSRLGRQMAAVARTITIRDQLNVRRQVFFVSTGGFDTHSGQAGKITGLQTDIANSLGAFKQAMVAAGMWNDVTVFTASDFGRTLNDNGDGTDHAWGAHHFVMGGGVNGGRIYGDIPSPDTQSAFFTRNRGRMIPTISVEQYAASLGSWFGLNRSELVEALPNLDNFSETVSFV